MSYDSIKRDTDQLKETAIDELAKTARRPWHDFEEWFYLDIGKEGTRGLPASDNRV